MRLSKEKREELKALAEKATAGPWSYGNEAVWPDETGDGNSIPEVCDFVSEDTGCFIAASRQALPDALADIEELESKLADAVKALEKYGKHPDSCPKGVGIGYYKPPDDAKCNCGIDASITVKP